MDNPFVEIMNELVSIRKELASLKANLKDTAPQEKDKFIEINDACVVTCLKKKQIYHLCSTSAIPHYKNGKLYFKEQELIDWMNQKQVPISLKGTPEFSTPILQMTKPNRKKCM